MGRPLKIAKSATNGIGYPQTASGVVGGNTSITGDQILCRVKVGSNAEANGFIIRQKGKSKYLVQDASGNRAVCSLANTANGALIANTMTVTCTFANSSTFRAKTITNRWVSDFSGVKYTANNASDNTTTPETVAVAVL
jgi:hypothetical protein